MYMNNNSPGITVGTFEEAKAEAYSRFKSALIPVNPNNLKAGYICPICQNGLGSSKTGITESPSNPNHFTCFKNNCFASSSGDSGDVFDLVANHYHLEHNSKEAMEKTNELLGIKIDFRLTKKTGTTAKAPSKAVPTVPKTVQNPTKPALDIPLFCEMAHYKLLRLPNAGYDYLISRGLTPETIKKFTNLGYCSDWRVPNSPYAPPSQRIIIKRTDEAYLARALDNNNYSKMTVGSSKHTLQLEIFDDTKLIWVVEGELDAFALYPYAKRLDKYSGIVALCSTTNKQRFVEWAQSRPNKDRTTFILLLDNDSAGGKATREIEQSLQESHIKYFTPDVANLYNGLNDTSESVTADRDLFKRNLSEAFRQYIIQSVPSEPTETTMIDDNSAHTISLKDYTAKTCAQCEYKAPLITGTMSFRDFAHHCSRCRHNLKAVACALAYFDYNPALQYTELSELLAPDNSPEPQPRKKPHPKGKTATYYKRYGKAIKKKHSEGKNPNQIANELGISPTTVRKLLDQFDLPRKQNKKD